MMEAFDTTPALPADHLAYARQMEPMLTGLMRLDLVFAVTDDGKEHLVKGRRTLTGITKRKRARSLSNMRIPVPSIEFAGCLEKALGGDGDVVRRRKGEAAHA